MARIFISHSSANNFEALSICNYLGQQGWDDVFLDLDPKRGIVAGERWERALSDAANRCEAVVFVISRPWLESRWCLREFNLAVRLNKKIFGVLIEDINKDELPAELTSTWQIVKLWNGQDHELHRVVLPDGREQNITFSKSGLTRLKSGLQKSGLDARFFAWPPESDPARPPYRGLRPLEMEDAGIFFGREADVIQGLDLLRGLALASSPRLLVIMGASGSGKSSFLRAGLLARLRRDDRVFIPLPVVRPLQAAITGDQGLVSSLLDGLAAVGMKTTRAEVRTAVDQGVDAVAHLLGELVETKAKTITGSDDEAEKTPQPTIVIAVDQSEELFQAEGQSEARELLQILHGLLGLVQLRIIVVFTIRSDSYELLQTAPELEGLHQHTQSLPALRRGSYQTVIEGPAERLKDTDRALNLDPALTVALLTDIEEGGGKDALPLLSFTLERLYREHGGDGNLTLSEYRALGGIRGSIEAAVKTAMKSADIDLPRHLSSEQKLTLLRRAFIPWMAVIDPETGTARRRVARHSEIPEDARPMVKHFVASGLLATEQAFSAFPDPQFSAGEASLSSNRLQRLGEATVEPTHEALLRQWGELQAWLGEESASFTISSAVKHASAEWQGKERNGEFLTHQAGRLEDALELLARPDFARFFDETDRAYLEACSKKQLDHHNRELSDALKLAEAEGKAAETARQIVRRTKAGAAVLVGVALVALGFAWYGFDRAQFAAAKEKEAIQGSAKLAITSAQASLEKGRAEESVLLLLDAAKAFEADNMPPELPVQLNQSIDEIARTRTIEYPDGAVIQEASDALYVIDNKGKDIYRLSNSETLDLILDGQPNDSPFLTFRPDGDAKQAVLVRENYRVEQLTFGTAPSLIDQFSDPRSDTTITLSEINVEISQNGWAILTASYPPPAVADETAISDRDTVAVQIVGKSGSTTTPMVIEDAGALRYFSDGEGREFLSRGIGEPDDGLYEVMLRDRKLSLKAMSITEEELDNLDFQRCAVNGGSELEYSEYIGDQIVYWQAPQVCTRFSDSEVLFTLQNFWSLVLQRDDQLVSVDGTVRSLADILRGVSRYDLGSVNATWSGTHEGTLGLVSNRTLFVFDKYELFAAKQHQGAVGPAHFLGGTKIAVAEPSLDRITVYDWGKTPRRSLTSNQSDGPDDEAIQITRLHKGTCLQNPDMSPGEVTVLRGRHELTFFDEAISRSMLRVSVGAKTLFELSIPGRCLEFSPDLNRILVVSRDGLDIFDVENVITRQTFDDASIGSILGEFTSASFFRGGQDIITTGPDGLVATGVGQDLEGRTVRVWSPSDQMWTSREIYRGDTAVVRAEADASGQYLAMVKSLTRERLVGVIYAIAAQRDAMLLGENYRRLDVGFTTDGKVALGMDNHWSKLFHMPALAELKTEAEGMLSEECRPANADDYRQSACWPQ